MHSFIFNRTIILLFLSYNPRFPGHLPEGVVWKLEKQHMAKHSSHDAAGPRQIQRPLQRLGSYPSPEQNTTSPYERLNSSIRVRLAPANQDPAVRAGDPRLNPRACPKPSDLSERNTSTGDPCRPSGWTGYTTPVPFYKYEAFSPPAHFFRPPLPRAAF